MMPYVSEPDFPTNIYRYSPRHSSFSFGGLVSGGAAFIDAVPSTIITIPVVATPQIADVWETIGKRSGPVGNRYDGLKHPLSARGFWDRPMIAHTHLTMRKFDIGNGTVKFGLGLGTYNLVPAALPAADFPADALHNVVHLYRTMDVAPIWQLHVNTTKGGGTQTTVTLGTVTAPVSILGDTHRLSIYYKPDEYIKAMIDGVLGAEITNIAQLPDPATTPEEMGLSFFGYHQGAAATVDGAFLDRILLTAGIE